MVTSSEGPRFSIASATPNLKPTTVSMGSYDFVTADEFGKGSWPFFWPLVLKFGSLLALFWARFGPLAKRRFGRLATLIGVESRLRTRAAVQPLWE